ncbi:MULTISPECIES: ATP-binding protein [unclassified Oceanispirochaeta]|uniref:ATP-binding protein n=1 Tax=unclassified Oceanispirochaeta TaxID=2635722 RepID=UPI0018F6080F|nr:MULTISPECIES: ATP-binding protein [unclassified Oceanispirochaeta]
MSRIRIKNFGPIKEGLIENDGWIDINKITLFVGNQGSGKSTVAKLISTFFWIEKALYRGDFKRKWFEEDNRLKNTFLPYHRLERYLNESDLMIPQGSEIDYEGDAFKIKYLNGKLIISENENYEYSLPQIMYVPSERNFLSYMGRVRDLKLNSQAMSEFLIEFEKASESIKKEFDLPINNAKITYDRLNRNLNITGENYRISLSHSSSGFQSLVPLFIVTHHLSQSILDQKEQPMSPDAMNKFKREMELIWSN